MCSYVYEVPARHWSHSFKTQLQQMVSKRQNGLSAKLEPQMSAEVGNSSPTCSKPQKNITKFCTWCTGYKKYGKSTTWVSVLSWSKNLRQDSRIDPNRYQRDEKKVEAVEHLAASQDVAESHVAKDADRRDDGLQNALNPGETVALIY